MPTCSQQNVEVLKRLFWCFSSSYWERRLQLIGSEVRGLTQRSTVVKKQSQREVLYFSHNESRLFLHLIMYCNLKSVFLQVLQLFLDSLKGFSPCGTMYVLMYGLFSVHVFLSAVHNWIRNNLWKEMINFNFWPWNKMYRRVTAFTDAVSFYLLTFDLINIFSRHNQFYNLPYKNVLFNL